MQEEKSKCSRRNPNAGGEIQIQEEKTVRGVQMREIEIVEDHKGCPNARNRDCFMSTGQDSK